MEWIRNPGKRARLYRLLYGHGVGFGKLLILPVDQGLEHGPRDFFALEGSIDPAHEIEIALRGGFSAIALQVGLAEKYWVEVAGRLPLILKINGKTEIPSDEEAFSPCHASVEDAVRLGAEAVGYTLYVGSPAQDRDFIQFGQVRRDCEKYGMPLVVWAYPRGRAIEQKGGRNSLYAVDYAARVACELGADVVKLNFPDPEPKKEAPSPYHEMAFTFEQAVQKVIRSAGKTLVIFSGGSRVSEKELLFRAKVAVAQGATGFIFGRNIWQRPVPEALKLAEELKAILLAAAGQTQ